MSLTLVTWNLKGSKGVNVRAVADHIRAVAGDVVLLQEVQRRQAVALARELGAASVRWGFKHWPVRVAAEGMAVIGVSRPAEVRIHALSCPLRFWSWRRRIFQVAAVEADDRRLLVVNVHLTPRGQAERRDREVARVLAAIRSRTDGAGGWNGAGPNGAGPEGAGGSGAVGAPGDVGAPGVPGLPNGTAAAPAAIVAGDFNDEPDAAIFAVFAQAGLRDAWAGRHPNASDAESATNWRAWTAGTTTAPARRFDYVLVPEGIGIQAVLLPRFGQPGFTPFTSLSDHLPVTATLDVDGSAPPW